MRRLLTDRQQKIRKSSRIFKIFLLLQRIGSHDDLQKFFFTHECRRSIDVPSSSAGTILQHDCECYILKQKHTCYVCDLRRE